MEHASLVVILGVGGSHLDCDALDAIEGMQVTWARVEREGDATCLAARVCHGDDPDRFRQRIRRWGAARGWLVTVAPERASRYRK
jgi:hypothetical protein